MKAKCDNCDWEGPEDAMEHTWPNIPDLIERIGPGGEVPAGECPKCGALCYVIKEKVNAERL